MKTIEFNNNNNYSLRNIDNFKQELNVEISEVILKYSFLLIDYFKLIIDNIKFKNKNFSKFIIIRGIDTIRNVFSNILFYTKNIDITYFHCQKSFYYYIEFVGQILEDEKIFLQLTSRDATTYVYKKTIFEITNDLKEKNENHSIITKEKINLES